MITGSVGNLKQPETSFKVKKVQISSIRVPIATDFNVGSQYFIKNEETLSLSAHKKGVQKEGAK